MILKVNNTTRLIGKVTIPSSKSQCVRALLIGTLAKGESVLHNVLEADDTNVAIQVCNDLGARIQVIEPGCHGLCIKVKSEGAPLKTQTAKIFTGNSGITTRFVLPILGLRANSESPVLVDCDKQMRSRPIMPLTNSLGDLGMEVVLSGPAKSSLPAMVKGKLVGGKTITGGVTSQYLSSLLLTCGLANNDTVIGVKKLHERPYVEMTLNWLKEQNIEFLHIHNSEFDEDLFKIKGGQKFTPFEKIIAADFSSASYFMAIGALIPGEIVVDGLDLNDPQGDKRLIDILLEMGADLEILTEESKKSSFIRIKGGRPLKGIKIDANDIPDLLPTLAVLGTRALGKTEIVNVAQARIKETDRINSMAEGLKKMGAKVEETHDSLTVYESKLYRARAHGYSDHRTIMALSLAGMLADGESQIDTAEGINKTFPNFVTLMNSLGAKMELTS